MGLGKNLICGRRRLFLLDLQIGCFRHGSTSAAASIASSSSSNNLAEAFNKKPPGIAETAARLITEKQETGLFCREELVDPESFAKMNRNVRSEVLSYLDESQLPREKRSRKMVEVMDDMSNEICKSADLVECVRLLHDDEFWKAAAETSMSDFTQLVETLNTTKPLYEALLEESEKGGPPGTSTDEVDRRITELFLEDFRTSGIHLQEDSKASQFVWLSSDIFRLGSTFTRMSDENIEIGDTANVPPKALETMRFTRALKKTYYLDSPLCHNADPYTRRWSYETYHQVSESQEMVLKELLFRRSRLAQLVGFENFAARTQICTLFETPKEIDQFLCGVNKALLPESRRELCQLIDPEYLQNNSGQQPNNDKPSTAPINTEDKTGEDERADSSSSSLIGIWDYPYYCNLYKQLKFGLNPEKFNPYFLPGCVMSAVGTVVQRIYGITLKPVKSMVGETWHHLVQKLEAVDENGNMLGTIYCDLYERAGKFGGDSHFTVRCSKQLANGQLQKPVVVLSMTLPKSNVAMHPATGEHLFHEMGHAMHSMLGQTRYQHVSGTRCATDLAETPSNLMERFYYCPQVLSEVLRSSTSESFPLEYAEAISQSNLAFAATDMLQQSAYALFDIRLHSVPSNDLHTLNTVQFFNEIFQESVPLAQLPQTAWHHRFAHLVSYGGKYYSYTVAKALSCLLWQKLFEGKPFSRDSGLRWAKAQSYGGEKPTGAILEEMLGFRPEACHLIEALHKHVRK